MDKKTLKLGITIIFLTMIVIKFVFAISQISPELFSIPFIFSFSLLLSVGLLLIPYSFVFLFRKKKGFIYFYLLDLLISFLLLANTLYFEYFHAPISIYTFYQFHNLSGLGESIVHLFKVKYLIYLMDLMILPFFYKLIDAEVSKKKFVIYFAIGILTLALSPVKNFQMDENDIFRRFDNVKLFMLYGPIGYHLVDTMFFVKNLNKELTVQEKERIEEWFEKRNASRSDQIDNRYQKYQGIGKGKNLIVIQVESLQNFMINKKINNQEITPNINKLLKNSMYFTHFYPQTIEGNSSDAEFLVNTSLFPLKQGSVFFRFPNNTYHTLPLILEKEGYDSFAIHADEASFWNRAQVYPNFGYNKFYDMNDFVIDEEIGMGLNDISMFKQSVDILKNHETPYLSYIITLTSHVPFKIPDQHKKLNLPDNQNNFFGDYLQSIRYTDESIGLFIEELDKQEMLQDSVIIIFGDHNGVFEKDKALVEQWEKKKISHEEWVRSYVNIPFIVYHPSINGEVNEKVGGQVDLLPTLAYLMGIDTSQLNQTAMGTNLFSENEGFVLIPGGGYIEETVRLTKDKLINPKSQHVEELDISNLIIEGNFFGDESKQ